MYQTIANLRNIEMDGLAADWQTLAHVFACRLNSKQRNQVTIHAGIHRIESIYHCFVNVAMFYIITTNLHPFFFILKASLRF